MIKEHLAQAMRHVAEGERHIERQRALIAELERHQHDTREARKLLETFLDTQELHRAERDRLEKALLEHPR